MTSNTYTRPEPATATEFRGLSCYQATPDQPSRVQLSIVVPTVDDAKQLASLFPKSLRVRSTRFTTDQWTPGQHNAYGYVELDVRLIGDDANGGVNETGVKRYRTFTRKLAELGYTLAWDGTYWRNSYQSQAEFEAAIA
jgi:hypothetical protein